jgi:hypothetical protein
VGLGPPGLPRPRDRPPDRARTMDLSAPSPTGRERPVRARPAADPAHSGRDRCPVLGRGRVDHRGFRDTLAAVPDPEWALPVDPAWSFADHIGHIATWFHEAAGALELHRATSSWREMPRRASTRSTTGTSGRRAGRPPARVRRAVRRRPAAPPSAVAAMSEEEWLDPEGFSWAYECLHGHIRAHHAMVGRGWRDGIGRDLRPAPDGRPGTQPLSEESR